MSYCMKIALDQIFSNFTIDLNTCESRQISRKWFLCIRNAVSHHEEMVNSMGDCHNAIIASTPKHMALQKRVYFAQCKFSPCKLHSWKSWKFALHGNNPYYGIYIPDQSWEVMWGAIGARRVQSVSRAVWYSALPLMCLHLCRVLDRVISSATATLNVCLCSNDAVTYKNNYLIKNEIMQAQGI